MKRHYPPISGLSAIGLLRRTSATAYVRWLAAKASYFRVTETHSFDGTVRK
jgi:hypothetical protein